MHAIIRLRVGSDGGVTWSGWITSWTAKPVGQFTLISPQTYAARRLFTAVHARRFIGYWGELERDFNRQGGQDGVFELHEGQMIRRE